jgi:hypothetical protein
MCDILLWEIEYLICDKQAAEYYCGNDAENILLNNYAA